MLYQEIIDEIREEIDAIYMNYFISVISEPVTEDEISNHNTACDMITNLKKAINRIEHALELSKQLKD